VTYADRWSSALVSAGALSGRDNALVCRAIPRWGAVPHPFDIGDNPIVTGQLRPFAL